MERLGERATPWVMCFDRSLNAMRSSLPGASRPSFVSDESKARWSQPEREMSHFLTCRNKAWLRVPGCSVVLRIDNWTTLSRGARWAAGSDWKGRKQHNPSATHVSRMDRVSTRLRLYRMSLFPGLEPTVPNIPTNILSLQECQLPDLGRSHGSVSCSEWYAGIGGPTSCLTVLG
jgi:hypothetical protein